LAAAPARFTDTVVSKTPCKVSAGGLRESGATLTSHGRITPVSGKGGIFLALHNANTTHGFSGAPIFAGNKIVAMHNCTVPGRINSGIWTWPLFGNLTPHSEISGESVNGLQAKLKARGESRNKGRAVEGSSTITEMIADDFYLFDRMKDFEDDDADPWDEGDYRGEDSRFDRIVEDAEDEWENAYGKSGDKWVNYYDDKELLTKARDEWYDEYEQDEKQTRADQYEEDYEDKYAKYDDVEDKYDRYDDMADRYQDDYEYENRARKIFDDFGVDGESRPRPHENLQAAYVRIAIREYSRVVELANELRLMYDVLARTANLLLAKRDYEKSLALSVELDYLRRRLEDLPAIMEKACSDFEDVVVKSQDDNAQSTNWARKRHKCKPGDKPAPRPQFIAQVDDCFMRLDNMTASLADIPKRHFVNAEASLAENSYIYSFYGLDFNDEDGLIPNEEPAAPSQNKGCKLEPPRAPPTELNSPSKVKDKQTIVTPEKKSPQPAAIDSGVVPDVHIEAGSMTLFQSRAARKRASKAAKIANTSNRQLTSQKLSPERKTLLRPQKRVIAPESARPLTVIPESVLKPSQDIEAQIKALEQKHLTMLARFSTSLNLMDLKLKKATAEAPKENDVFGDGEDTLNLKT
jgi:hypothetical protein